MRLFRISNIPTCSTKLCPRKEPERGCLKRTEAPAPKESCPILTLPSEIRAEIFKYLLDDVGLTFKFCESFISSSCWATWPEYHKNLSFLRVCRLFEQEGTKLVQIESIKVELKAPPECHHSTQTEPKRLAAAFSRSSPQSIDLSFETIRPHLKTITIDAKYALSRLLETDLLEQFLKLQNVRIAQTLWPRECQSNYREQLNTFGSRQLLLNQSLGEVSNDRYSRVMSMTHVQPSCCSDNMKLGTLLNHSKLKRFYPISVDVSIRIRGRAMHSLESEDGPQFPITRDVSALRFTYEWPSKKMTKLEVDMYNQVMALAIKTEWTESVPLGRHGISPRISQTTT